MFSFSFIIITSLGILNVLDNFNNKGVFFGFGGDDRGFFNNINFLLNHKEVLKSKTGTYELILYVPAKIISLLLNRNINLMDLLPFNWFIGATIPVLLNSISKLLFKTDLKIQIILLSLLLNNKFYDTINHLYRDSLLYVSILGGIIAFIKKKYLKVSLFGLLAFSLRGAHGLLLVLFLSLMKTFNSAKYIRNSIILIILFSIGFALYQSLNINIYAYMSELYEVETMTEVYQNTTLDEIVTSRESMFKVRSGHQGFFRQLTYSKNLSGIVVGMVLQTFYPITFHLYYLENKYDPSRDIQGFSFIEEIKWFSIIAWIWVVPLLILGFQKLYKMKGIGFTLLVHYFISMIIVTIVSMQSRHGLIFVIFHPLICQLGYNLLNESEKYKFRFKNYQLLVVIFLFAWNVFKIII